MDAQQPMPSHPGVADAAGPDHRTVLEQVFQHVSEGICIFDAERRLVAANRNLADLLGLTPALLQPGTALDAWFRHLALHGHYGAIDVETEVARRMADVGRPGYRVSRRHLPDGRGIETRRSPMPDGGFAMVCVDITDRLASEAALVQNQQTLNLLLRQTEEGFWFIDNDHRTTDANPAMCRMLGVTREALIGRTIWEFVDAENEAVFRVQVARRDAGQANSYEVTLTREDGSQVVCVNNATPIHDAQGRKIGAIGLFSDVTATRQKEAELRRAIALLAEKSRALELTLESLAQGVLGFDARLRVHSWNRRAAELLGLPADLLASQPTLVELGHWQQAQGAFGPNFEHIEDADARSVVRRRLELATSDHDEPLTYRRRSPDGRTLEVRSHHDGQGGQVRTYTDVTAEVLATELLHHAKEEAERANRAKSDFLSRMSHELRTPLNSILGFGQLMAHDREAPLPPAQQARLQQILAGGQHLLTLISEVLDIARIETGTLQVNPAVVDADALIDECLRFVEPVARDRPVLLWPRDGEGGRIWADPTRLRQVLLNLLANAIKFNHVEGEVRVRCIAAPPSLRIEVNDTGPGLDAAQRQRLFKPFERLDADLGAIEGTGIGLALSRHLVECMGGRIGVDSDPGEGSCFWVELPQAVGIDGRTGRAVGPAAPDLPRRVLYIEDNAVNQVVMQGMFTHRPRLALELAATPEQGLAMAAAHPPDLLLVDIQLPGASGYDVLRVLRSHPATATLPVLAVSANAMPEDLDRAREAGFDGYLTKPLALPQLLQALDRWLGAPGGAPA